MPLDANDKAFLKFLYQQLRDDALEPGDPRYQPVYEHEGCEDPVEQLQRRIEYSDSESLSLFSGFRGSGKTTELFRLRKRLEDSGAFVVYADALEYVNPAAPVEISNLLITLAGAFSDGLEEQGIEKLKEGYWSRLRNFLEKTDVNLREIGIKTGADLKLELRTTPTVRQRVSQQLSGRIGELTNEVHGFFEDGVKAIRGKRGDDVRVVFLFDSLEQVRGSVSDEQSVISSVERLFSSYLKELAIPYVHVVYTVPPWLKFVLPGADIAVLPCVRLWINDPARSECGTGMKALRSVVEKRFGAGGLERFFGPNPSSRVSRLLALCGGHFRDLLLLLRETVLRADALPVAESAIDAAIVRVRSNFLPIPVDDARWLAEVERERKTPLHTRESTQINKLTWFLDTHVMLYLKNGEEWYDVHPLVREEVLRIAGAAAQAQAQ